MDDSAFLNSPTGYLVEQKSLRTGESYRAYVPYSLPRSLSPLQLDDTAMYWTSQAEQALGRLDGTLAILPRLFDNQNLLMMQIIYRREAVASTQIEGTQITDLEAQRYEVLGPAKGAEIDYREVTNYIDALKAGQGLLDTLPISTRYLCRLHEILLSGLPRGRSEGPHGRLRDKPVIIGASSRIADARFIPPPAQDIPDLIQDWAEYANARQQLPVTVQAALLHYQFETIHPFMDGNGRLGRLLITLFFYSRDVLRQPFLYLSGYLLKNRMAYYDAMLRVSQTGVWSEWVSFFARGITEQSNQTAWLAQELVKLYKTYIQILDEANVPETVHSLVDVLFEHQTITTNLVIQRLNVTAPTARKAISTLVELGILTEQTGRQRYKEYVPEAIVNLFD